MTLEQRQSIQGKCAVLQSPPILPVEVVSPESVKRDKEKKPQEYAALKISECWLVDPIQNQVTVLTLVDKQYEATHILHLINKGWWAVPTLRNHKHSVALIFATRQWCKI